jgi:hypothetical protein
MRGPLYCFNTLRRQCLSQDVVVQDVLNLASYLQAKHFPDCCAVCGRSNILKGTQGLMITSVMSTTVSVEPHNIAVIIF